MYEKTSIINVPVALSSKTIKNVIKQLDDFVKSDNKEIILNFQNTNFVTPGGLTPLLCYMLDFKNILNKKWNGAIVESEKQSVEQYLSRMGFYELLGITDSVFYNKHDNTGRFQELYCFSRETPDAEILIKNENIIKTFTLNSDKPNYIKAIQWCVCEIVDNAKIHADSLINILFAQKYPGDKVTEFCVADRGLGIKETMGEPDIEIALINCIKQARGTKSEGMGNGLYYTAELIRKDYSEQKSFMSIMSEDAILYITSGSEPTIHKTDAFWQGTVVTLSLNNSIQNNIEEIKGSVVYGAEDLPDFYE